MDLLTDEFAVAPVGIDQLAGRTIMNDPAAAQDDDPVEIAQRRKAMRDGDHGSAVHQPRRSFSDQFLDLIVERRCRLVEQENRRILEKSAGQRDTLSLATGQFQSPVADDRVEPLRK